MSGQELDVVVALAMTLQAGGASLRPALVVAGCLVGVDMVWPPGVWG